MHSDSTPNVTHVNVAEGHVVTIVANGLVDVDGPNGPAKPTTAAGFIRPDSAVPDVTRRAAASGYLLSPAHYVPSQSVGALIGSFDGFRTSFVIGTNASFGVPRGAKQLALAINGKVGDYRSADGDFEVNIIDTPAPHVPTSTSVAFDTPFDMPAFIEPWKILTATHIITFYEAPVRNPKSNAVQTGRGYLGEAHVSIYRSAR
jgi:hypothetical protein